MVGGESRPRPVSSAGFGLVGSIFMAVNRAAICISSFHEINSYPLDEISMHAVSILYRGGGMRCLGWPKEPSAHGTVPSGTDRVVFRALVLDRLSASIRKRNFDETPEILHPLRLATVHRISSGRPVAVIKGALWEHGHLSQHERGDWTRSQKTQREGSELYFLKAERIVGCMTA